MARFLLRATALLALTAYALGDLSDCDLQSGTPTAWAHGTSVVDGPTEATIVASRPSGSNSNFCYEINGADFSFAFHVRPTRCILPREAPGSELSKLPFQLGNTGQQLQGGHPCATNLDDLLSITCANPQLRAQARAVYAATKGNPQEFVRQFRTVTNNAFPFIFGYYPNGVNFTEESTAENIFTDDSYCFLPFVNFENGRLEAIMAAAFVTSPRLDSSKTSGSSAKKSFRQLYQGPEPELELTSALIVINAASTNINAELSYGKNFIATDVAEEVKVFQFEPDFECDDVFPNRNTQYKRPPKISLGYDDLKSIALAVQHGDSEEVKQNPQDFCHIDLLRFLCDNPLLHQVVRASIRNSDSASQAARFINQFMEFRYGRDNHYVVTVSNLPNIIGAITIPFFTDTFSCFMPYIDIQQETLFAVTVHRLQKFD